MVTRAERKDLFKMYKNADPEGRLNIMLDNYDCFPGVISMVESKIRYKLRAEREFLRSHKRGVLGVRVQTSFLGDPTAEEAVSEASLDEAFAIGKVDRELLKGIDEASAYEADILAVSVMSMDYRLLVDVVNSLNCNDLRVMNKLLVEKKLIKDIAVDEDRCYDATKKRIARIRADIKEEIMECLEMNYRRCLV